MRCVNGSLTCHKILHGASSFTSHPKEGVLWIFKNLSPRLGLKPQPLGPVASTLTATPLRRLCSSLMPVYTYEAIWCSNGDDQHQPHLSNLCNLRVLGRSYMQYSEMMLGKKTWPMEIRDWMITGSPCDYCLWCKRREKCTGFWWESPRETDHLEDQGIDERIGTESILQRMAWGGGWGVDSIGSG
jgi:hypothetical protein